MLLQDTYFELQINDWIKLMRHKKYFFIIALLFTCASADDFAQQVTDIVVNVSSTLDQSNSEIKTASIKLFVVYLKNVIQVLHASSSTVTTSSVKKLLRIEELFTRVEDCFDQGAFALSPLIKTNFYALFADIDQTAWPTPAMVRRWKSRVDKYKTFLLAAYFSTRSASSSQVIDYQAIDAIMVLYSELTKNILTDEFFDFSTWEFLADICVALPIEFAQEHPFILVGGIITLIGIGFAANYYVKKNHDQYQEMINKWSHDNNAQLMLRSQEGNQCGINAAYAIVCKQNALGNAKNNLSLLNNEAEFKEFRGVAREILALRGGTIAQQGLSKGLPIAPTRVNLEGLENGDVRVVLEGLHQRGLKGQKFGLLTLPVLADSVRALISEKQTIYRDKILKNKDKDSLAYGSHLADVPQGRDYFIEIRDNNQVLSHLEIADFKAKPGSTLDFVVNTAFLPDMPDNLSEVERNKWQLKVEKDNFTHFLHVSAINNPAFPKSVEIIMTDSISQSSAGLNFRANIVTNLRNLLGEGTA
jgi:hypothetical protein